MSPVAEAPDALNTEKPFVSDKAAAGEKPAPLTTQEKKERINQIFEELNKNNPEEEGQTADTDAKTEKTNEIFNELNNSKTAPEADTVSDQEKRQRLEDIFKELNR